MLPTEDELKKATVPQLRAICKDKGVVGYSKLSKAPLIAKLLEWQFKNTGSSSGGALQTALGNDDPAPQQSTAATSSSSLASPSTTAPGDRSSSPSNAYSQPAAALTSLSRPDLALNSPVASQKIQLSSLRVPALIDARREAAHSAPALSVKRGPACEPTEPRTSKKRKPDQAPAPIPPSRSAYRLPHKATSDLPLKLMQQNAALATFRPADSRFTTQSIAKPSNRFIPLRPVVKTVTEPKPAHTSLVTTSATELLGMPDAQTAAANERPLYCIDDIITSIPTNHPAISLPPSIRNRKHVGAWAIILSAVERADLPQCALVSRMIRYAVYLSAGVRLARYFDGKRLSDDTKNTPMKTANLWSYLRAREKEMAAKFDVFESSWLSRACAKLYCPIAWRLWTCSDHPKQATIAVRFLLTHLYFDVSVQERWTWKDDFVIIDAQEAHREQVWRITTGEGGTTQTYHVLEATCEVIGGVDPSLPAPPSGTAYSALPIRADWSNYVAMQESGGADSLLQHVSWEHKGEYERGISRLWLQRIATEGNEGREKLDVARRYVYACIVPNSVSGRYMRLTEMAQEFHGVETKGIASGDHLRQKQTMKFNLFLPGHHHVESVHFTTAGGTRLHAAVAVVQTPGREYFILRDNGMQIGCEEDGVAEVFMKMLGCDRRGVLV
ncbi:hypothetical protein HDZ31DRAFT_40528 [Schizophyllum fasciatum]